MTFEFVVQRLPSPVTEGATVADEKPGTAARSIQGEQQDDLQQGYVRASEEDVDLYVDGVSDEVIMCRERGRHLFPTIRQAGIHFSEVDEEGLFIRRLTCTCCRLAVRVERWEGARRGGRTRFARVTSGLVYQDGPNGEAYLAPSGRGHMTPRQIGDSVASKALAGQSLTALRKAAKDAQKAAEQAAQKPSARKPTGNATPRAAAKKSSTTAAKRGATKK
ncbi:hypothetical protein [Pseudonocardia halophobica]|uniref:hypothetical protein n=1 Tax=Pseudonocardia halophobica TaxID=29401 RepID=UPI0022F31BEC|nr:hypothetical protein [Pseudonocardia halophobica]